MVLEKKYVPVLLLTGYLGSGKTTLLNRILANRRGIKFAVIVNDIGEVNIDSALIQKGGVVGQGDDSLVALQNGCICCTLKMDLARQVNDLIRMNRFDYIVIEASGICEPAPIAQTICSIPTLGPEFDSPFVEARLDCIVTVVDALRMKDEFACGDALTRGDIGDEDLERLVIEQIEFCNMVLLNKASDVAPDELERVRAVVRALNPGARILQCDYGDVELDSILDTGLFDFEKVASSAAWISELEHGHHHDDDDDDDDDEEEDGHHHHHHHHDEGEAEEYGIGTYVYYSRKPLDFNKLDYMVSKRWPSGIIRSKGLCYFYDEKDKCYLFEQAGVQKTIKEAGFWYAAMPKERLEYLLETDEALRRDWDPGYGDRMVKIVFIGQNLDRKAIDSFMEGATADQDII